MRALENQRDHDVLLVGEVPGEEGGEAGHDPGQFVGREFLVARHHALGLAEPPQHVLRRCGQFIDGVMENVMIAVEQCEAAREARLRALEDREVMVVFDAVVAVEPAEQTSDFPLQRRAAVICGLARLAQAVEIVADPPGDGAEMVMVAQPYLAGACESGIAAPCLARVPLREEEQFRGQGSALSELQFIVHVEFPLPSKWRVAARWQVFPPFDQAERGIRTGRAGKNRLNSVTRFDTGPRTRQRELGRQAGARKWPTSG